MAEKIVSPGVFTNEIDQTFLPSAVADIGAALVGPTVKGPAGIPTIVTSFSEYQAIFGDSFKSGSGDVSSYYTYLTSLTAKNYLQNSDTLTVVRVLAGSFSGASTTISSSVDPAIVGTGVGGTKAKGSITLFNNQALDAQLSGSLNDTSMSIIQNGTQVDFVFTGSSATNVHPNTATTIFVETGSALSSGAPVLAQAFADAINNSSSLHNLNIIASVQTSLILGITSSLVGDFESSTPPIGGQRIIGRSPFLSGSLVFITGSSFMTGSFTGTQSGEGDIEDNSTTLRLTGGTNPAMTEVFKLHTLADGEVLNNRAKDEQLGSTEGIGNSLTTGSKDNIRYEISSVNKSRGTFTLLIRKGDDIHKRKQILETWNNVNLDPNSNDYIAKIIGDSYLSLQGAGTNDPYLQSIGDYPNKSKFVRVEVLKQTGDYLDENGNIRVDNSSDFLPSFHSGSNSGSFGGSFDGGSDGTVQHPRNFYENITNTNTQGLNPIVASKGQDAYIDALNLLSNQDEYDINLLLLPGIITNQHSAVASKAIDVCEDRGDCFVILDPVKHGSALTTTTTEAKTRNSNYAGMYWPWVQVNEAQLGNNVWVPPSVAVAGMYAFNDRVGHPWLAPAGLNRGTLTLARQAERKLTLGNRDDLYESNVNPIATFPGQGVCVWGQKTLQKKSSALDRINVRRLLIRVKKFIASSSRFLVFEQNTSATRRRFLSMAQPFLETVQSQSGLNAFRVVMDETNNTPDVVDRNIMYGQIFIQPTRTAEFITLDFTIQPTGATFPE